MSRSQLRSVDVVALLKEAGLERSSGGAWTGEVVDLAVTTDAAGAKAGDLLVVYRGVSFDSHTLIAKAIEQGVRHIVLEDPAAVERCQGAAWVLTESSRAAWPYLAARQWGDPQRKLRFTGVTGTNGKTSTVWIFRELLRRAGASCLSIGTIGAWLGEQKLDTNHTTPDPGELFRFLALGVERGVKDVAMEVSSHSLSQAKLGPIRFSGMGFTSFTRDHLDFHGTMADYFEAKWQLFARHGVGEGALSCFHASVASHVSGRSVAGRRLFYGSQAELDQAAIPPDERLVVTARDVSPAGSQLEIASGSQQRVGRVGFFGDYATGNFACALALAEHALGREILPDQWSTTRPVPGRLEPVTTSRQGPYVFVDYAHTPDALEKTLALLRPLTKGELWVVFGCGGDRDRGKRPEMGAIAARLADRVVVTSDNPRTEAPDQIVAEILQGITGKVDVTSIIDRSEAIRAAVTSAAPEDTVLIAGKGHEDYQIIGKVKQPFDDRDVAARWLV